MRSGAVSTRVPSRSRTMMGAAMAIAAAGSGEPSAGQLRERPGLDAPVLSRAIAGVEALGRRHASLAFFD
jgi:hypothetical protein